MAIDHILMLVDGRPGHDHLSEGVIKALERTRPRRVTRVAVRRRKAVPTRVLAATLDHLPPALALRVGYGLAMAQLPACDLVISAGGNTLAANALIAKARAVPNIFCGTLRHVRPEHVAVVVSSYADHAALPRHVVALKPSLVDPDALPPPPARPATQTDNNAAWPRRPLLIVGGNSGLFHYRADEWAQLADVVAAFSQTNPEVRWLISTSPRTPDDAYAAFAPFMPGGALSDMVAEFVDYRSAGPGTLPALLGASDAVLCTADSSSMISEAIAARRPVLGLTPEVHAFKDEEAGYRAFMTGHNWARFLPLADLTPDTARAALAEVTPPQNNHLDRLATLVSRHLDVS